MIAFTTPKRRCMKCDKVLRGIPRYVYIGLISFELCKKHLTDLRDITSEFIGYDLDDNRKV